MSNKKLKKRPCGICRHWFTPNNKLKKRQKTCAKPDCQKEWHKKTCAKWNKKNRQVSKSNYLQKQINEVLESEKNGPQDHVEYELPLNKIIKIFTTQQIIIIINIIIYHAKYFNDSCKSNPL